MCLQLLGSTSLFTMKILLCYFGHLFDEVTCSGKEDLGRTFEDNTFDYSC